MNLVLVLGFDAGLLYCWGLKSLAYLLVGVVAGGGLHPLGGHLIAEHYMFLKVYESHHHVLASPVNMASMPAMLLAILAQHLSQTLCKGSVFAPQRAATP